VPAEFLAQFLNLSIRVCFPFPFEIDSEEIMDGWKTLIVRLGWVEQKVEDTDVAEGEDDELIVNSLELDQKMERELLTW
jgi:hypothetical protein